MMIDNLIDQIEKLACPICIGLDPTIELMPNFMKENMRQVYGNTKKAVAQTILEFNRQIVDATHEIVPAYKLQSAMYEAWGPDGVDAYLQTVLYCKKKNKIVIGDIKRSDIGNTAKLYSLGHLGQIQIESQSFTGMNEDFVTLNPYMGYDSIEPFLDDCQKHNKGVFILLKTSNPSAAQIQNLTLENGQFLYEKVAEYISLWGAKFMGFKNYSSVAAVVGATNPEEGKALRKSFPHLFFLVPGYGAQGATAKDIQTLFDPEKKGAIINSSRGIIGAYLQESKWREQEFAEAARFATLNMKKEIQKILYS